MRDIVLLDDVPVAGEVGVGGGTLEDHSGDAEQQGRIYDVRVASDPAHVATAEVGVAVVEVEDVLAGHGGAEEVAGGRVHHALGLTGRPRGV